MTRFRKTWHALAIFSLPLLCIGLGSCFNERFLDCHSFKSPVMFPLWPSELSETSGLQWMDSLLWTHNDRGNATTLFAVCPLSGKKLVSIPVNTPSEEQDWECLAACDSFLYVGNTGNNRGAQQVLSVYMIPKNQLSKALPSEAIDIKEDHIIRFSVPEFLKSSTKKHNADIEAMVYFDSNLVFFTKNRANSKTYMLTIPAKPGFQVPQLQDSLDVGARITGADLSEFGCLLVGYNKKNDVYFWHFSEFSLKGLNTNQVLKCKLGSYKAIGQVEGVAWAPDGSWYFSREQGKHIGAALFRVAPTKR